MSTIPDELRALADRLDSILHGLEGTTPPAPVEQPAPPAPVEAAPVEQPAPAS